MNIGKFVFWLQILNKQFSAILSHRTSIMVWQVESLYAVSLDSETKPKTSLTLYGLELHQRIRASFHVCGLFVVATTVGFLILRCLLKAEHLGFMTSQLLLNMKEIDE